MPILKGRQASGLFEKSKDIYLEESVLLCMKLSALQWKRLNGSITLYTDTPMKKYLEGQKMLDCWDYVNTEVLDKFYENCHDINFGVFWSAGKFACYLHEQAPFVCIDTDLVIWNQLEFDPDLDFAFAHWERIEAEDKSYPDADKLCRPDGYKEEFISVQDYFDDNRACNMAITYIGNDAFRKEFAEHAMIFMRNNPVISEKKYAQPEVLYMEQRLPLMIACKNELKFAPVLNCTWNPKHFRIMHPGSSLKNWFFSDLNPSKPFTHLWFHKKYLAENKKANEDYCAKLRQLCKAAEQYGTNTKIETKRVFYGSDVSGCSKCIYNMWLSPDDPDYPEELKRCVSSNMYGLYCSKYSRYLGPYPPVYYVGHSGHGSMGE